MRCVLSPVKRTSHNAIFISVEIKQIISPPGPVLGPRVLRAPPCAPRTTKIQNPPSSAAGVSDPDLGAPPAGRAVESARVACVHATRPPRRHMHVPTSSTAQATTTQLQHADNTSSVLRRRHLGGDDRCLDMNDRCKRWADDGECGQNKPFMDSPKSGIRSGVSLPTLAHARRWFSPRRAVI